MRFPFSGRPVARRAFDNYSDRSKISPGTRERGTFLGAQNPSEKSRWLFAAPEERYGDNETRGRRPRSDPTPGVFVNTDGELAGPAYYFSVEWQCPLQLGPGPNSHLEWRVRDLYDTRFAQANGMETYGVDGLCSECPQEAPVVV